MSAEFFPVVSADDESHHELYYFASKERAEEWARLAKEASKENGDGYDAYHYVKDPTRIIGDDEPLYSHAASVATEAGSTGGLHTFRVAAPPAEERRMCGRQARRGGAIYTAYGFSAEDALERLRALMTQHGEAQLP